MNPVVHYSHRIETRQFRPTEISAVSLIDSEIKLLIEQWYHLQVNIFKLHLRHR
jgi:hypothetical protein